MQKDETLSWDICPLCKRPIPPSQSDEHHLIPKCKKGKETATLHRACHRQIHMLFTESELAHTFNTAEKLLENEAMASFVKWISTKPNEFLPSFTPSKRTKKKR